MQVEIFRDCHHRLFPLYDQRSAVQPDTLSLPRPLEKVNIVAALAEVLALAEKLLVAGVKPAVHYDSSLRRLGIEFQHRHFTALVRYFDKLYYRTFSAEKIRVVLEEKFPRLFPCVQPVLVLPVSVELGHAVQRRRVLYVPLFQFGIGSAFQHSVKVRRALYRQTYLLCDCKVAAVTL